MHFSKKGPPPFEVVLTTNSRKQFVGHDSFRRRGGVGGEGKVENLIRRARFLIGKWGQAREI